MFDLAEPHPAGLSCCNKHPCGKGVDSTSLVSDNNSTPRLNIVRTFSPRPHIAYIIAKLFILAWTIAILHLSITTATYQFFWMAYLTHWGVLFSTAYALMSAFSAIYLALRPPVDAGVLKGGIGFMIKTTWVLFATAAPAEVIIAILFWVLEFDGTLTYKTFMTHGGLMILVLIDGFVLSRIPIRMKQLIFIEVLAILFILWTVIHAYSGIGNPYKDDGSRDDDALYESLRWKTNTSGTAILSVLVVFVLSPLVFLLCRALSRLLPRRLCENVEGSAIFRGPKSFDNDEEAAAVVY